MIRHPVILLDPLSHWLDEIIREHGLDLHTIRVCLSPSVIGWILRG